MKSAAHRPTAQHEGLKNKISLNSESNSESAVAALRVNNAAQCAEQWSRRGTSAAAREQNERREEMRCEGRCVGERGEKMGCTLVYLAAAAGFALPPAGAPPAVADCLAFLLSTGILNSLARSAPSFRCVFALDRVR